MYLKSKNQFTNYIFPLQITEHFLIYFIKFFLLKNELQSKKQNFLEQHKNKQFLEYNQDFINQMNSMVISWKSNELLFVNDFTINFFEKEFNLKFIDESKEEILISNCSIDEKKFWTIKNYVNFFFKSLILKIPTQIDSLHFDEGKSFYEIISKISSRESLKSNSFIKIGYFINGIDLNCYSIQIRKKNLKENVVEVIINDVSDIMMREKDKIGRKIKQNLLAKIAHEFKTPLISINTLIYKINQQPNMENQFKICFNHINNLSNYSLFTITDVIQYASDSKELNLSFEHIDLKEIMHFRYESKLD